MKAKILFLFFISLSFNIFSDYRMTEASVACGGIACDIPFNHQNCIWAYDSSLNIINTNGPIWEIWAQAGDSCPTNLSECGDNVFRYHYDGTKYTKNNTDEFVCNKQTSLCPNRTHTVPQGQTALDCYAGPKFLKDSKGHEFLFYVHGNADVYNVAIEFKYRLSGQTNWSGQRILFKVASENITDCDCRGGFARITAIEMGNYIYIYFEVWRVVDKTSGVPIDDDACLW